MQYGITGCSGHKCDDYSSLGRMKDASFAVSEGGGQASTMFRGPGAGLAPAQPCPCGAPMRARLRFEGAGGRWVDVYKRLRRATNFEHYSGTAQRRTKETMA